MVIDLQIKYKGLIKDRLPSGNVRYLVRVEGDKRKRITLSVTPEHKEFNEHYLAARVGIKLEPTTPKEDTAIRNSIAWLTYKFESHMVKMVEANQLNEATQKQRKHFYKEFREHFGDYSLDMPQSKLLEYRDDMAITSAKADNTMSAIKAMYKWACDRGITGVNPAIGITRIHRSKGGATVWSEADLIKFKETHPIGTRPYIALCLFMFTACRVSDAILLGRGHEVQKYGDTWLEWQPVKKGASFVSIPALAPLKTALRGQNVIGSTYILTSNGQPYKTVDSFRNQFKAWCKEAGLPDRSPHGIRKAAGHILAKAGASQYQIMALHGHAEAQTSEVYTKGIERDELSREASKILGDMKW